MAKSGAPPIVRLGWLWEVWRARRDGVERPMLLRTRIAVPWREKPVRGRSPLLVFLLTASFALWPLLMLMWVGTARDLRSLGEARGVKRLRHLHPIGSAICLWLYLIPLFRAPRRIRDAQLVLEVPNPVSQHLAWLTPLWPVQCALLQRELNRLWLAAEGSTAPDEPAAAPERQLAFSASR